MTVADINDLASAFQSVATVIGVIVAGVWAYGRFVREGEKYAHIQTSAEVEVIGQKDDIFVVEIKAVLENKGKVELRIENLEFDLNGLASDDPVRLEPKWSEQVDFPHELARGGFLPDRFSYFVLPPGVTAKYSHVTAVPQSFRFLMLHCRFSYGDDRNYAHSMEKTVALPPPTPKGG